MVAGQACASDTGALRVDVRLLAAEVWAMV
jgi:hypothetical protein